MTIASTNSPLFRRRSSPEAAGSLSKTLAVRMLSSRLLSWFPVLFANGTPSVGCDQSSTARWYSGRLSRSTSQSSWTKRYGNSQYYHCITSLQWLPANKNLLYNAFLAKMSPIQMKTHKKNSGYAKRTLAVFLMSAAESRKSKADIYLFTNYILIFLLKLNKTEPNQP